MVRIKLIRSLIGQTPRNRATVAALGLRKIHQVVEHEDTPSIRGMIQHARHMLQVEVVDGSPAKKTPTKNAVAAAAPAKPEPKVKSEPKAESAEAKPKRAPKAKEAEETEA